jgi:hypothetical protein
MKTAFFQPARCKQRQLLIGSGLTVFCELRRYLQPPLVAADGQPDKDTRADAGNKPQDQAIRLYSNPFV